MTAVLDTLDALQQRAAQRFEALGWPTTRLEAWKYTSLAPVAKIAWRDDDATPSADPVAPLYATRALAELVFVNGKLVSNASKTANDGGVRVTSLRDLADSSAIGRYLDIEASPMAALNTAHFDDGALIEVEGAHEGFIHIIYAGRGDGIWSHPRTLILAGRASQIRLVESYVGSGNYFTNAVTELVAGEGAVVDHVQFICESTTAFHVGLLRIQQERASQVTSRSFAISGGLIRNDIHGVLAGEGAALSLEGLFVGVGDQHIDNHTLIDHVAPHCDSQELYKGVLDDRSRGIFDGTIIVRPGAQKTVSRQVNRNLLLSETAVVDSKPTLEIHNDDVKCNHGSTIGQLDEEALFYLRSRGIDADEARSLLIHAFASEIIDRVPLEPVREQLRRAVFEQMPERLPERRGASR